MISSLILALATLTTGQSHETNNPLYARLRDEGVQISPGKAISLTPPLLSAGADATAAKAAIGELVKPSYSFQQFSRKSAVAPQILHVELLDGEAPARRVDVYFIAYGSLDELAQGDVPSRLLHAEEPNEDVGGQGSALDEAALAARGIELPPKDERREEFAHGSFTLLKKVEIEGTVRSAWSRAGKSLVAALELDPRFARDADFPNRWRALERDAAGRLEPTGDWQPYGGVGGYVQLTELSEPPGALLAEWHLVFSEPHGWFDGANLLGSKLPAIVQDRVRATRRELAQTPSAR
ncbi:MAG: hypothetical protein KF708_12020 [Pirellulales bacterium]|nr:hypothetical protein [Pirellulales bacterium]